MEHLEKLCTTTKVSHVTIKTQHRQINKQIFLKLFKKCFSVVRVDLTEKEPSRKTWRRWRASLTDNGGKSIPDVGTKALGRSGPGLLKVRVSEEAK